MTFTRYELTIPVELTSELHIGGVDEVPERDGKGTVIRFCRNGLKEPTIPGRSIRGAVRAACDIARQAMKDTGDPATQNGEAFSKENWISLWGDDTDYTGKSLLDRRLRSDNSLPIRQSALTFHAVSFPEYKDSDSENPPYRGVTASASTGRQGLPQTGRCTSTSSFPAAQSSTFASPPRGAMTKRWDATSRRGFRGPRPPK